MERLWAPWRFEYIERANKGEGCVLCKELNREDGEDNLILKRTKYSFVIMNRYPYNSGHLMVCPVKHIKEIENLSEDETADLIKTLKEAVKVLKVVLSPQGYNLGLNAGGVAGAGVKDHLHFHIVPRWQGDTNFMPVISETKVISEHLVSTYKKLKSGFDKELEGEN